MSGILGGEGQGEGQGRRGTWANSVSEFNPPRQRPILPKSFPSFSWARCGLGFPPISPAHGQHWLPQLRSSPVRKGRKNAGPEGRRFRRYRLICAILCPHPHLGVAPARVFCDEVERIAELMFTGRGEYSVEKKSPCELADRQHVPTYANNLASRKARWS